MNMLDRQHIISDHFKLGHIYISAEIVWKISLRGKENYRKYELFRLESFKAPPYQTDNPAPMSSAYV